MARHQIQTLSVALLACAAGCAHCDTCDDFPAPANIAYGAPGGAGGEYGPILAPTAPLMVGQDLNGGFPIGMPTPMQTSGSAHMPVPHYQPAPPPPSAPASGSNSEVKKVPDETTPPALPEEPRTNSNSGNAPETNSNAATSGDNSANADPNKGNNEENTIPIVPIP